MTATIGSMIADSAKIGLGYAERLLVGIETSQFGSFARAGDRIIESNHPAFIYGHLSLYPSRIVSELGGDATSILPSSKYEELFSPKATCVDDPENVIYPGKDELVEVFFSAHNKAVETLLNANDDLFAVENPNEAMRSKFATKGAMHAFYVGGHLMMHIGQLSAWRRAVGLAAG